MNTKTLCQCWDKIFYTLPKGYFDSADSKYRQPHYINRKEDVENGKKKYSRHKFSKSSRTVQ